MIDDISECISHLDDVNDLNILVIVDRTASGLSVALVDYMYHTDQVI